MADRPKLPKSIVVLNIIMAVVLLAICALAVALFVQAKDLGWSLPTPDSSPVSSAASNADAAGADTAEVQRLFQNDLSSMISRYTIIRQAELYRDDIAIASVEEDGVERVTAAQAADELLTLKGVQASFVLYQAGSDVSMSARSLGEINVQVIVEALGGGGNSTTAGGRIPDTDVESVHQQLIDAIDQYFEK